MVTTKSLWAVIAANAAYLLVLLIEGYNDQLVNWYESGWVFPFLAVVLIPFIIIRMKEELWTDWWVYFGSIIVLSIIWIRLIFPIVA